MQTEPAGRPFTTAALRRHMPLVLFGLVVAYAALLATTLATGIWLVGPDGRPIATDFVSFWSAGHLVWQGQAVDAYDWTIHRDIAAANGISFTGYFSFQYPPTYLLLTPFFALMSYPLAVIAWSVAGLSFYLACVRVMTGGWKSSMAALAWPAVLWNIVVGQTGFLTAGLLGAGIALVDRRPALAGILFGLLTYKPQFGLLIPVALIAGGRWTVILWAAISAAALASLSLAVFGVPVWAAFLDSIARINTAILTEGGTNFAKIQSLYGYARALGLDAGAAWLAHGLLVAALAVWVALLWRSRASFDVKAAGLAAATILASPYAFIYDLVALAVPLIFLGRTGFSDRELPVVIAAALLVAWGPAEHVATGLVSGLLVLFLVVARVHSHQAAVSAGTVRGKIRSSFPSGIG